MTKPTIHEIEIARTLVRYQQTNDTGEYRRIVEFLAADMLHDGADWKNMMMFHLTGTDALCNFKN